VPLFEEYNDPLVRLQPDFFTTEDRLRLKAELALKRFSAEIAVAMVPFDADESPPIDIGADDAR
jgi:hypothetical protein